MDYTKRVLQARCGSVVEACNDAHEAVEVIQLVELLQRGQIAAQHKPNTSLDRAVTYHCNLVELLCRSASDLQLVEQEDHSGYPIGHLHPMSAKARLKG